jgi:ferric-dicitrate binding protein FerR (iron transport regulator)
MKLPTDHLSITDFLEDEAFQTWMKERRPEDRLYWQEWLDLHPERREIYEQAVAAFLAIEGNAVDLSDEEIAEKKQQLLELMPDHVPTKVRPFFRWSWAAAAAIIGLTVWWQFNSSDIRQPSMVTQRKEEKQLQADSWETVKNTVKQPLLVLLPDHSSVLLSAESSIRFRKQTNEKLREVFLQGEGFFEVAKNSAKPFLVYTNNLTVKVVGTTFQVHSFDNEGTVFVKVKAGKVAVAPVNSPARLVYITANQSLSLESKTERIIKEESKSSEENSLEIVNQPFTYDYTPVSEIFNQFESIYHMPIRYDRELLKSCSFTGQLNDVPFLEKIRLICLTIESTFEVVDNQVLIHSHGCH